jgi:hypothetical protein
MSNLRLKAGAKTPAARGKRWQNSIQGGQRGLTAPAGRNRSQTPNEKGYTQPADARGAPFVRKREGSGK